MRRVLRRLAYGTAALVALVIGFFAILNYVEDRSTEHKIWEELVAMAGPDPVGMVSFRVAAEERTPPDVLFRYDLICFITGDIPSRTKAWLTTPVCDRSGGKANNAKQGDPNVERIELVRAGQKECIWVRSPYRVTADICIPPSRL